MKKIIFVGYKIIVSPALLEKHRYTETYYMRIGLPLHELVPLNALYYPSMITKHKHSFSLLLYSLNMGNMHHERFCREVLA